MRDNEVVLLNKRRYRTPFSTFKFYIKTNNSKRKYEYETFRISEVNLKEFLKFEYKIDVNDKLAKKNYKT